MAAERDLVQALFAAATDAGDAAWPGFLDLACEAHRADSARLQIVTQGRISETFHCGLPLPGPALPALQQMRNDRVYSQIDLPGGAAGPQALRALKAAMGPQDFAVLSLQRVSPDFRAADTAQLSRLGPYLGQAVATWTRLAQDRARAGLAEALNAARGTHWLQFAASGKVTGMSPGLPAALAGMPALRLLPSGWLDFNDPAQAAAFRQALSLAPEGGTTVLDLSRVPQSELVIAQRMMAGTSALIGTLHHAPQIRTIPVERFAQHFTLNRSEARLTQLLCDGFSLQAAGEELGWTLETARSCSKQVFARMGVKGQTGVLRRVYSSAVWQTGSEHR